MTLIDIPYDVFESDKEIVIVMPLWWIKKDSVVLHLKEYKLYMTGRRYKPALRDDLVHVEKNCYRWEIKTVVDLPPTVYFKDMHTTLSPENILTIIVPKNIEPDTIHVEIE